MTGVLLLDLDGVLPLRDVARREGIEAAAGLPAGTLLQRAFGGESFRAAITGELDDGVLRVVREQRRRRRVLLLTNSTSPLPLDLAELALDGVLDGVFDSADLGVAKPDPRIFELVLHRLGGAVDRCAFVDDSPANVATATGLGLRTHRYRTVAELREFLQELPDPG